MDAQDDESVRLYLERVRKITFPLPRIEELELARRIANGEAAARLTLAEHYLGLAAECAEARYGKEGWRGITLKELIQEANTGLSLAVARYGKAKNKEHHFTDFARGYITLYLDRLVDAYRHKYGDTNTLST